jgi:hypothetical protein
VGCVLARLPAVRRAKPARSSVGLVAGALGVPPLGWFIFQLN